MIKERTYTVVSDDGRVDTYTLPRKATLQELQTWVGGMIEPIMFKPGSYGYVNEEGLMIGLKRNSVFPQYVGPVVVLPKGCRT